MCSVNFATENEYKNLTNQVRHRFLALICSFLYCFLAIKSNFPNNFSRLDFLRFIFNGGMDIIQKTIYAKIKEISFQILYQFISDANSKFSPNCYICFDECQDLMEIGKGKLLSQKGLYEQDFLDEFGKIKYEYSGSVLSILNQLLFGLNYIRYFSGTSLNIKKSIKFDSSFGKNTFFLYDKFG